MEAIPLGDATVDVVVTNGALNLSTRKSRALAEMVRVLRPGGRLSLADLVVTEALPEDVRRSAPALAA
jgi:ubiquinone/menaquinone biosynthesis C-methylase UbiE